MTGLHRFGRGCGGRGDGGRSQPGQVVSAGTPVVRIAQDGVRDAVIPSLKIESGAVKVGAPAAIKVWGCQTNPRRKVREVAAGADSVTRTLTVKISALSGAP